MEEIGLEYDCLIEILRRLPVKSLIRFTCVCKGWLSIIRSPEFVTKHYLESQKKSVLSLFTPGCSISIFSSQNKNQNLTFETAFKFRPAVAYDPLRYHIYHRDIINHISILGHCNGLFLMSVGKGFLHPSEALLLWNPATREFFKLPPLFDHKDYNPNSPVGCLTHGFGYDNVTRDYKIVGLYALIDGIIDYSVVWLYSLATNSWRQLHHAYDRIQFDSERRLSECFSSNGRMHSWILSNYYPSSKMLLLSFDMVDEVFVETPLPPDEPSVNGFMNHDSNQPSVYSFNENNGSLNIWVLSGYGSTGVWNKLLNINLPILSIHSSYMVLCNNNEIIFNPDGTITSFNLTTKQMKSLGIPADDTLISYTESLVSIANSVRQQRPDIHHSSLQINNSSNSNNVMGTQQMLPQEEDDDDSDNSSSSTDSAFLTPDITAFNEPNTVYIDYEADLEFYPLRLNEIERLSSLPYCLLELNRPMVSNPFTF